ncbi:MAG: hypothetical protein ACK4VI_02350 [Alphaproteobacteria bacterium]
MTSHLIHYVILGAIRDRLLVSLCAAMVVCISLSLFLGSAAIIEQKQFMLVFASGALRMAVALGLVLFVVFFIRRSFETKDIEFLLSRPISRLGLILSYSAAFTLMAVLFGLIVGISVCVLSGSMIGAGHFLWILSICAEFVIVVNVAFFFSMVLSSAASGSMATIGFYILARMMGQLLGVIDANIVTGTNVKLLEQTFEGLSIFFPRLDLYGQTSWLLYGSDGSIGAGFIFLQTFIFTALVLAASYIDLKRRQF